MITLTLKRNVEKEGCVGTMQLTDTSIYTLELPWKNNESNVSCIPVGTYKVKPYSSEKFPNCFELQDVPGRSNILIHAGNTTKDTHGCILVGMNRAIGQASIMQSKIALKLLRETFPEGFNLKIEE